MIRKWLWLLVAWDGLVPLVLFSAPFLVRFLFPNDDVIIVLTALALPLAVMVVRFLAGKRRILLNRCSDATRYGQAVALCMGIVLMLFVDAMMVLTCLIPNDSIGTVADWALVGVAYAIYLGIMAIAMYPGKKGVRNRLDPLDWLSAAVICNGEVICKPLFTVELEDRNLPDICYRMKLIRSSRKGEQREGESTAEVLSDAVDLLDAALRGDCSQQVEDWHELFTQLGAHYQLDGEAPIEIDPLAYSDFQRRFDDVFGKESAS